MFPPPCRHWDGRPGRKSSACGVAAWGSRGCWRRADGVPALVASRRGPGPLAQWESASLTRKRSLVQIQYGPRSVTWPFGRGGPSGRGFWPCRPSRLTQAETPPGIGLPGVSRKRPWPYNLYHPGLVKNPQAVELADRLDDPSQHQLPEHLVPAGRLLEPQRPVRPLQGLHQVAHPRGGNRQRPAARGLQAQVKLLQPGRDPLLRRGLQRLQLRLIVSRPQVLDLP
jgi:hypothetical protein